MYDTAYNSRFSIDDSSEIIEVKSKQVQKQKLQHQSYVDSSFVIDQSNKKDRRNHPSTFPSLYSNNSFISDKQSIKVAD